MTADDLGRDEATNAAIERAAREGLVTRASLMVTGAAVEDALARLAGLVPIGLHLDLTEGHAAAGPLPPITDGTGRFRGRVDAARAAWLGRLRGAHLEAELDAQLERARALGARPGHLDGHHHVHVFPGVFERVLAAAARHGVPEVRVPSDDVGPAPLRRLPVRLVLRRLARGRRERARRAGFTVADAFAGPGLFRHPDHAAALDALLRALPEGTTELMVHPGDPAGGAAEVAGLRAVLGAERLPESGVTLVDRAEAASEGARGGVRARP